jgi:hypothetical protein
VIAAADHRPPLAAAILDQAVAAMLADIVEGAQLAVAAADDDDALIEDLEGDVGAGLAELALMRHRVPGLVEDPGLLFREDGVVIEEARRQRVGQLRIADIPIRPLRHRSLDILGRRAGGLQSWSRRIQPAYTVG